MNLEMHLEVRGNAGGGAGLAGARFDRVEAWHIWRHKTLRQVGRVRRIVHHVALALIVLISVYSAGAMAAQEARQALGPGDSVRLVPIERTAKPNSHPAMLSAEELKVLLGSLQVTAARSSLFKVRRDSDEEAEQLFQEEDLDALVPVLSQLLAGARPQEDVAIVLKQVRRGDIVDFFRSARVTTVRMFVGPGEINLIFGGVNVDPVQQRAIRGTATPKTSQYVGFHPDALQEQPIGSREKGMRFKWNLGLPPGARYGAPDRNDWLVLDMASARAPSHRTLDKRGQVPVDSTQEGSRTLSETEIELEALRTLYDKGLIDWNLYREKSRQAVDRMELHRPR